MSSIDDKALERAAGPLFDALTSVPARQAPLPMGPDAGMESYYTLREHISMRRGDFDLPSCLDLQDFERRLAVHWKRAGHAELADRAPLVAEAARALHALYAQAQPEAEVSPYIYTMF
jgi:hypothetical protein